MWFTSQQGDTSADPPFPSITSLICLPGVAPVVEAGAVNSSGCLLVGISGNEGGGG